MPTIDVERFRLRTFANRLLELGEIEVHPEPVPLIDLSRIIEATDKASWFKAAGPEGLELVAAVAGSRRRVAAALEVDVRQVSREYLRRLGTPQPIVEVPSAEAPVHQVVHTGDDIDLSRLPFFLQHELDGGPYISSAIDYSVDPLTGRPNVGCRRLMLRDERTLTSNLTQESDLKGTYRRCVEHQQRLPVNFVIGSHPLDFLAATLRLKSDDEFGLVAALRGQPLAMVRGLTTGVLAPADAEMVIEGYFDAEGWRVLDGPYGEWWGFYGPTHPDPLFHVTAITMRRDVLHQSVLHGTRHLERCDSGALGDVSTEANLLRSLQAIGIQPAAVYHVSAAPSGAQVRVALERGQAGQARAVIDHLFSLPSVKHVTVVDADIDVSSHDEVSWAMATRLRPDRDVVITSGFPTRVPTLDHTSAPDGTIAKIGFDATVPAGVPDDVEHWRPLPPRLEERPARSASVQQALSDGPRFFIQLMEALGSRDGREIAVELERLRAQGLADRSPNGEWCLVEAPPT